MIAPRLPRISLPTLQPKTAIIHAKDQAGIIGRLGDSDQEVSGSDFKERWRRFLACINIFQFADTFTFWTSSEATNDAAPDIVFEVKNQMPSDWELISKEVISRLKPVVEILARESLPVPTVEYFNEGIDDDAFAELAWIGANGKIAILTGDQQGFSDQWQHQRWKVVLLEEIEAKGISWLIKEIKKII